VYLRTGALKDMLKETFLCCLQITFTGLALMFKCSCGQWQFKHKNGVGHGLEWAGKSPSSRVKADLWAFQLGKIGIGVGNSRMAAGDGLSEME
jgi:hypothetical protein